MWVELAILGIELSIWAYHRWWDSGPTQELPTAAVLPRVEVGTSLALVYGQCRIRTPILVWSGNALVPGQEYSQGNFGSSTQDHFSIDALFVLGIGFYGGTPTLTVNANGEADTAGQAKLLAVWAGDTPMFKGKGIRRISTTGINPIPFNFGDNSSSEAGGSSGQRANLIVDGVFYCGTATQDVTDGTPAVPLDFGPINEYFSDGMTYGLGESASARAALIADGRLLSEIPGLRNQICVFMHIGNALSQSIPGFSFEVRSLSTLTASDLGQSLEHDADPAAVILDILTAGWGRIGLSINKIDVPSFRAASLTLFNEGNGYSRVIDQATDASAVIQEILKQIDGVLYVEPTSGLITLRLIRNDYDVNTLREINPDNAEPSGAAWYVIQGWDELPNQVRLSYSSRGRSYANDVVLGQNDPNIIDQSSRLRTVSVSYPGCCEADLAQRLASRELAVLTRPFVKATVTVTREFHDARVGDVLLFRWPPLGIVNMVMRVAGADYGQLHDGRITLNLLRDNFDAQSGAYPVPPELS